VTAEVLIASATAMADQQPTWGVHTARQQLLGLLHDLQLFKDNKQTCLQCLTGHASTQFLFAAAGLLTSSDLVVFSLTSVAAAACTRTCV
jgi:hypothetical protein